MTKTMCAFLSAFIFSSVAGARTETRFPKGSFAPSFALGFGGSGSSKTLIVGAGLGYFFIDRLEAGPSYLFQWQSEAPTLQFFELNGRYIVMETDSVAPYLKAKTGYVLAGSYGGVDFPDGIEVFGGPGLALFITRSLTMNAELRIGRYFFQKSDKAKFAGGDEIQYEFGIGFGVVL